MSYDIYIGNAELETDWPGEDWDGPHAEWVVSGMTHPDAPFKPDMTENSNGCHPGYGQWGDAMRTLGLDDVWFAEETGLLSMHPGIKVLTAEHLARFESAREAYRAEHPDRRPGFCPCYDCDALGRFKRGAAEDGPPHDPTWDSNLSRLDWMCWWAKWALENCERPAVYNR